MPTYIDPGLDASGNGNNWTTYNINWTGSGSTFDTMTDVPTLTSATAANFCTWNPLDSKTAISSANLNSTYQTGLLSAKGTVGVSSGKWYWEVTVVATGGSGQEGIGIGKIDTFPPTGWVGDSTSSWGYWSDGVKWYNSGTSSYGASYTTGDVIGVALDMDAGTLVFYKNNSSQGTAYSSITGTITPAVSNQNTSSSLALNCGQRPFAYTPPTGYVALNTYNLPTPTIGATASSQANKYMDATTYTGNGSTQSIVNAGGFQPDFVWMKIRSLAYDHTLQDAVRGTTKYLNSNNTAAEDTATTLLTSFNSNGFSLGNSGNVNQNSQTYVAWQWRASNTTPVTNTAGSITSTVSANTTSGFSVVTFSTNASSGGATIGHGLGVAPKMIIMKARNQTYSWDVYHASLGASYRLILNSSGASQGPSSDYWNSTSPTSSVFSINQAFYGTGVNTVAYCFAEVDGFSKIGSFVGNGSADGPFVYCGFRPKYIISKSTSTPRFWFVTDTSRDTYNVCNLPLFPNDSQGETAGTTDFDILSNGFKARTTNAAVNGNGETIIYMAFAESPFKYANAR